MNTVVTIKMIVPHVNLTLEVLKAERDRSEAMARNKVVGVKSSPREQSNYRQRALELTRIIESIES